MLAKLKTLSKSCKFLGISLLISGSILSAQQTQNPKKLSAIRNISSMIDKTVEKDLASKKLKPFPTIDTPTFLRRSYVNIIGRIPTHQEATQFLNSRAKDKKSKLIDKLVYSKGYESKTFNYWADLLRLISNDEQYGLGWHIWLRNSVAKNKPYDKMVYEMLSATGHTTQNKAVGYYLRDGNMLLDNVSNTAKVFLGTRIGCAQCHDDPYEEWTQKQYYQFAAFGAHIDYKSKTARDKIEESVKFVAKKEGILKKGKNKKKAMRKIRRDIASLFKRFRKNETTINISKQLKLPDSYEYNDAKPGDIVKPNPLFSKIPNIHNGHNRLENFAAWITSPKNPQFTKTIANRLWKHVYGYGLAASLDNWTDRTKVSHPATLALIEKILIQNKYNIRETLRILYHTKLFQRRVSTEQVKAGSRYYFQGPILRRLSAEELHDSLLTLNKGNVDAVKNPTITTRWQNYTTTINSLLTAKPETIIAVNKVADKTNKQLIALRTQFRKIKSKINKAIGDGQPELVKKFKKERRALSLKLRAVKEKNASMIAREVPMAASMANLSNMNRNRISGGKRLRASELPAPAKPQHFLRRFGASDRQTSNAARTNASIPQTLTLLNGKEISMVANKKGYLSKQIFKAKSVEQKLQILFLSIYSRYPTQAEIKKYSFMMKQKNQILIFAKAMLNSKRFLFLQ